MSVDLTTEQQLLKDAVRDVVREVMPIEAVMRQAEQPLTIDDDALWLKMSELGLPGVLAPETVGGAGLGLVDVSPLLEEIGSALVPAGFAVTAVISASLLLRCAGERAGSLLGALASGKQRIALAAGNAVTARRTERGYVLEGSVPLVAEGRVADTILLQAELAGAPAVFVVGKSDLGLVIEPVLTMDPTRRFDRVILTNLNLGEQALLAADLAAGAALQNVKEAAMLATACDSLGIASAALTLAVEYAKVREQFGSKIGSFQGIKHLLADTLVATRNAQAAVRYAAMAWDANAEDRHEAILAARVLAGRVGVQSSANCIQVHGGIGFTKDLPAHLYLRRAKMNEVSEGSVRESLQAIGDRLEQLHVS